MNFILSLLLLTMLHITAQTTLYSMEQKQKTTHPSWCFKSLLCCCNTTRDVAQTTQPIFTALEQQPGKIGTIATIFEIADTITLELTQAAIAALEKANEEDYDPITLNQHHVPSKEKIETDPLLQELERVNTILSKVDILGDEVFTAFITACQTSIQTQGNSFTPATIHTDEASLAKLYQDNIIDADSAITLTHEQIILIIYLVSPAKQNNELTRSFEQNNYTRLNFPGEALAHALAIKQHQIKTETE